MLGKASQLEPNITEISRDFKRARYQKLAFVEIYKCIAHMPITTYFYDFIKSMTILRVPNIYLCPMDCIAKMA